MQKSRHAAHEVTRRAALGLIRLPAVRELLVAQGAEVSTMAPAEIDNVEMKHWAEVVAKAGLKLE